jgi:hypothetical protein
MKFGTKMEIFSMDLDDEDSEERRNSHQVNAQAKDSSLVEEENKKMYTALL